MAEGRRLGTELRIGRHSLKSSSELTGGIGDRSANQRVGQFQPEPRVAEDVRFDSNAIGSLRLIECNSSDWPAGNTARRIENGLDQWLQTI